MNPYLKKLTSLISNCAMDNTYKMSWARAITEYLVTHEKARSIHFDELSPLIFKYYWNQIIFFNLNQGPNPNKPPIICQIVQNEIDNQAKLKPILFTRIENQIEIPIKKVSDVLSRDVSHRFLKIGSKNFEIYELEDRTINVLEPEVFRKYSDILFELINYRWTQKLEECNSSPLISK